MKGAFVLSTLSPLASVMSSLMVIVGTSTAVPLTCACSILGITSHTSRPTRMPGNLIVNTFTTGSVTTVSGMPISITPVRLGERQSPAQADKQGEVVRHWLVRHHSMGLHGLQSGANQDVVKAVAVRPSRRGRARIRHHPETVAQTGGD